MLTYWLRVYIFSIHGCRLFEWIFFNVHSEEVSDDERAVYLNGLHEVLANDGGKSPHTQGLPVSVTYTNKSLLHIFFNIVLFSWYIWTCTLILDTFCCIIIMHSLGRANELVQLVLRTSLVFSVFC